MAQIIAIESNTVKVGTDDGKIVAVPIAAVNYANPQNGDQVNLYQNGETFVVTRAAGAGQMPTGTPAGTASGYTANEKKINKHVFVWVGTFLFGGFGVDRFLRGQVGLGICKLLFAWITCGIWPLVDWIIAMTKAYGSAFSKDDEVVFINGKYAR